MKCCNTCNYSNVRSHISGYLMCWTTKINEIHKTVHANSSSSTIFWPRKMKLRIFDDIYLNTFSKKKYYCPHVIYFRHLVHRKRGFIFFCPSDKTALPNSIKKTQHIKNKYSDRIHPGILIQASLKIKHGKVVEEMSSSLSQENFRFQNMNDV